jgi:hypothetical protein
MRIFLIMIFVLSLGSTQAKAQDGQGAESIKSMINDDGGFGAARFSSQVPVALTDGLLSPLTAPANIEPAAGEENLTPVEENPADAPETNELGLDDQYTSP